MKRAKFEVAKIRAEARKELTMALARQRSLHEGRMRKQRTEIEHAAAIAEAKHSAELARMDARTGLEIRYRTLYQYSPTDSEVTSSNKFVRKRKSSMS
jgi:hypothetical protein